MQILLKLSKALPDWIKIFDNKRVSQITDLFKYVMLQFDTILSNLQLTHWQWYIIIGFLFSINIAWQLISIFCRPACNQAYKNFMP